MSTHCNGVTFSDFFSKALNGNDWCAFAEWGMHFTFSLVWFALSFRLNERKNYAMARQMYYTNERVREWKKLQWAQNEFQGEKKKWRWKVTRSISLNGGYNFFRYRNFEIPCVVSMNIFFCFRTVWLLWHTCHKFFCFVSLSYFFFSSIEFSDGIGAFDAFKCSKLSVFLCINVNCCGDFSSFFLSHSLPVNAYHFSPFKIRLPYASLIFKFLCFLLQW